MKACLHGGRWWLGLLLCLAIFLPADARAQAGLEAPEYRVKATFVYRFGEYVQWPKGTFAHSDSPLRIGVLGADELADELGRLVADRRMAGQPVQVRKLLPGEEIGGLELVFVGATHARAIEALAASTRGSPVLIVSESEQGVRLGSAINFVIVDSKVRFDIALPAVESRRIKISSRLLSVARKVVAGAG